MSIWIITTGNSDVQLKTDDNWEDFYGDVRYDDDKDIIKWDKFACLQEDKATELYPVTARILGIVYENHLQDNYDDLAFPLLDTFTQYFLDEPNKKPSIIIVLLTDQRNIFVDKNGNLNEKVENEFSPFWQDTCTLEPMFKKYFQQREIFSSIKLEFHTLRPAKKFHTSETSKEGLDNWENTLDVAKEEFKKIQEKLAEYTEYDPNETVYVSHQAGTPAISSAVQFVSLSNFKNVRFLSSNIFFNNDNEPASEPQIVDISNYWMGIQIEKAKQLVRKGLPGAALSMLEEIGYVDTKNLIPRLKNMVSVFNICESLIKKDENEFYVKPAIQRVVDSLSLIELFFKEKNYIQGITLLAAAHETFLKAAIINELYSRYETFDLPTHGKLRVEDMIVWNQEGLGFKRREEDTEIYHKDNHLKNLIGVHRSTNIKEEKIRILGKLSFPVKNNEIFKKLIKGDFGNFSVVGSNQAMVAWIRELCKQSPKKNFQSWRLLTWIGQYTREREADRRNQLMHNLRGVTEEDVIRYLLGDQSDSSKRDVLTIYQQEVKEKFLNEIKNLGLPYNERNLYDELEAIANDIT
ncbi:hypothetical protein VB711_21875 [Cronbergia sp. UHCC 0137]|uniref:hypothetical protein n=1 Tax=Cronbergia sp. UHCC 0137 TaxID=3110239 RepID=UPI002B1FEBDF|nr:hypothetical protein [Cronbergia sp. UHCC 0137]MEA5620471.1 hypothetical protein [Cronbergia sp. UHCC 0137]